MIKENLIKDLDEIISIGLENYPLPFQRGNSIRIKNYAIRKSSKGFMIFNCETNKTVAITNFKTTAVAIAKCLSEGKDVTKDALFYDEILAKHYNDAIFYKRTIKCTNDPIKKDITEARLQLAIDKSKHLKDKLDDFIF